jgi:hypothetical protein
MRTVAVDRFYPDVQPRLRATARYRTADLVHLPPIGPERSVVAAPAAREAGVEAPRVCQCSASASDSQAAEG